MAIRHIISFILSAIALHFGVVSCSLEFDDTITVSVVQRMSDSAISAIPLTNDTITVESAFGLTSEYYNTPLADMPEPTKSMKVNHLGNYAQVFNDSNYVHLTEAENIGIVPVSDTRSHWHLRRPLVKIASCKDFYVEPLTYSRPYLVPEAAAMLHEIGRRFQDTIASRGGGDYSIKVTSVLRTPESIEKLQKHNVNAIDSSVHQYGTTIDISYARFAAYSDVVPRSAEDLKGVLAEVLFAMRDEGKCWVKYERHQPCFHITARKPND